MTLTHPDDLELARRAIRREPSALHELGKRFGALGPMVAGANRRNGARLTLDQQQDLVQDVTLLLWQKLETFEGRSTLEGWAWTYVHFQVLNRIRRVARHRRQAAMDLDDLPHEPMAPPGIHSYDRQSLERCLTLIPPGMAEVLRLKHFEGLIFREIAEHLGVSENTVKTRYYRGLVRARSALAELEPGGDSDGE